MSNLIIVFLFVIITLICIYYSIVDSYLWQQVENNLHPFTIVVSEGQFKKGDCIISGGSDNTYIVLETYKHHIPFMSVSLCYLEPTFKYEFLNKIIVKLILLNYKIQVKSEI